MRQLHCIDCSIDLTGRAPNTKRCKRCYRAHKNKQARKYYRDGKGWYYRNHEANKLKAKLTARAKKQQQLTQAA